MRKLSKFTHYYANKEQVCQGIRFTRHRWKHIKAFIGKAASGLKIPPPNNKGWKAVCDIQTFARKWQIVEGEYILKKENGDIWVATPGFLKTQGYRKI